MSSMLKSGGLSKFKPKAKPNARRAAPAPASTSQIFANPTSENSSTNETAESQSQVLPPALPPIVPATSNPRESIESAPTPASKGTTKESTDHVPNSNQPVQSKVNAHSALVNIDPSLEEIPRQVVTQPLNTPSSTVDAQAFEAARKETYSTATRERTTADSSPAPVQPSFPTAPTTNNAPQPATTQSSTSAPEGHTLSISKEAHPLSAGISGHIPSPSGSFRNALPSPSPFPVSETITAVAPPSEAGPSSAARKKRAPRKRKAPAEGVSNGEGSASQPKRQRTLKQKEPATQGVPASGGRNEEISDGEVGRNAPKNLYRRGRRELTPENAEELRIDPLTTKLGELTKDMGIGKKFKHADIILERQKQARLENKKRRLQKMGLLPGSSNSANDSRAGTPAEDDSHAGSAAPTSAPEEDAGNENVAYEVIDGQIVVNQASLQIDQTTSNEHMQTVEEDEFTHLTTSASYSKRDRGANHWTDEDTERFYHYLKMFGTDFETISHMFPGRTRRHIKLKFNREERQRPKRVNSSIMARGAKKVAVDLEEYKENRFGQGEWQDPANILEEQRLQQEEHDAELETLRQERRDLGLLDDDEPATSNSSGAKKKNNPGADDEADADAEGDAVAEA